MLANPVHMACKISYQNVNIVNQKTRRIVMRNTPSFVRNMAKTRPPHVRNSSTSLVHISTSQLQFGIMLYPQVGIV